VVVATSLQSSPAHTFFSSASKNYRVLNQWSSSGQRKETASRSVSMFLEGLKNSKIGAGNASNERNCDILVAHDFIMINVTNEWKLERN
jgi:hypothetical protein